MATYRELKARMAALEGQVATARASEIAGVLADIRAKIAEFGLTEVEVFGDSPGRGRSNKRAHAPLPPIYRDPVSGSTWSGRGRAPSWIANVKKREKFLIR
ncbi:H-NS family nucleoid-associated regulatory protein [Paraburkholderia tropica]|uniref:H-NS histone family protein n=1 Tax=Paraburkholderia tropica TaxID=92647 RepID=UPI0009F222C6|nr:H-NS histone family protein [Paraburkholderia tropica]